MPLILTLDQGKIKVWTQPISKPL